MLLLLRCPLLPLPPPPPPPPLDADEEWRLWDDDDPVTTAPEDDPLEVSDEEDVLDDDDAVMPNPANDLRRSAMTVAQPLPLVGVDDEDDCFLLAIPSLMPLALLALLSLCIRW